MPFIWGGVVAPETYIPIKNRVQRAHLPWDVDYSPRKFLSPEIVPFELYAGNKHRTENNVSRGSFLELAKPLRRNSEISHGCTFQHTDSCLLLQTWSKSLQDKRPKGRVVLVTKTNKTRFGGVWRNTWGDSPPFLCECALRSHTYIPGFILIRLGLGKLYPKNPSATQSDFNRLL